MSAIRARLLLAAALVLGVSGDLLFRAWPWRLSMVGWVATAILAASAIGWERPFAFTRADRGGERLLALGLTFASAVGLILRDAPTLYFYDFVAMLTAAALAAWLTLGRSLVRFRVGDMVRAWFATGLTCTVGAPVVALRDVDWETRDPASGRRFRAAAIGSLLAVPPVLLVGSLLGEADPVFGTFLTSWNQLGLEKAFGHLMLTGVVAWPTAGWLRGLIVPILPATGRRLMPATRIDFLGVAPALYAVTGLLAAFLGLQARALFGGAAYVEATTGLTYAEYARHGFFELVAVTAIVLALLLLGDWALDRRQAEATKRFRSSGWVLVALLGVLMASALQRMWVYVSFYGLSDTRAYATAGMGWVGVALGWFGWTVLRGRRARFGIGLLLASFGWVALLNGVDPEAVVVRVNLARARAGAEFDVPYHTRLSADAVPALLRAAGELPTPTCLAIISGLHDRWAPRQMEEPDWRTWSLPVSEVDRAMTGSVDELQRRYCASISPSTL